jgi:hypothetical protein
MRDQDFASTGWTLHTLHQSDERYGQNGERLYGNKDIALMDRKRT